jgi:hypothetical protein
MTTKAPPPSSSLRPPVHNSGSGKYVAVVALLGVGLVGLILWKHYSAEPVAVVTVPSATPSTLPPPPIPKEDDIPPPPPVEDSGPETGPVRSTGGSWTACDARVCSGRVTGDLESALAFRAKTAHKCYDDALAQDATLKGSVKIGVRVAANGNICSATVAQNDLGNASVAGCIANRFRQAGHFPAPAGGCLDVAVPISLLPPH